MTTDITELAQLRGRTVDYPYYLVECDCGKIYPSSELSGGEPMGDSGDYSDCYCPHCGEGEEHLAECADPETVWKAQQDKIDTLVEALEKAQQRIGKLEKKITDHKRMNQEMAKAMLTPNDSDAAGMEIAALRQRIAELESRTVTVKLPDIMPPEAAPAHYWGSGESMAYADGYNKSAADLKTSFALSCSSAGVNVEFE